ncbi:hypothetical protein [Desulfosudis oleivorans]|uniref:Uncharacterized protein n=1 Tax=Desulfosudis oleivorans (strain DSM 6200 / JCM 39069 / Hxd3) TaxID=96561 RepID=A8ZSK3_DESOH|nr:hypothetical protein [Desulfosudis oleivorans]ABW65916.1 conserved hypothetical protein [Desulfosudis oleivorans Hxd3]
MKIEAFSPEEKAARKQAIFDAMSPRAQRWVQKKGYDKWDPFQEPKDPIDMRKDKTRRTSQVLIREFLQTLAMETYSTQYARGAFELCLGIINEEERALGMFAFASWYRDLLEKEGIDLFENQ